MAELPEELEEVKVARVQPGDIIVARLKKPVTVEQEFELHEALVSLWPMNKVLVLDPDTEIEISRPDPGSASPGSPTP